MLFVTFFPFGTSVRVYVLFPYNAPSASWIRSSIILCNSISFKLSKTSSTNFSAFSIKSEYSSTYLCYLYLVLLRGSLMVLLPSYVISSLFFSSEASISASLYCFMNRFVNLFYSLFVRIQSSLKASSSRNLL